MINCRCPKCQAVFGAASSQFGQAVSCGFCSHSWTLDVEHIARYQLPRVLRVRVRDRAGAAVAGREVEVEYNYPVLTVQTGADGSALLTGDMIRQGLRDYIALDGIMDHKGDHACQRYIRLRVGQVQETVDLSSGRSEVEIDMTV